MGNLRYGVQSLVLGVGFRVGEDLADPTITELHRALLELWRGRSAMVFNPTEAEVGEKIAGSAEMEPDFGLVETGGPATP